jgi:pimeloyl-ACP methyl ester carboxylesterase
MEHRSVTTAFGPIAYSQVGSGPPALFVHGVFVHGGLWRHVTERLAGARTCIAVDLPAHGRTPAQPGAALTFTENAAVLAALCDALQLPALDLVANDSGGGIAQIFAAHHPTRVRTLTLTNCDVHDRWPPPSFAPVVALARAGKLRRRYAAFADVANVRALLAEFYEDAAAIDDATLLSYAAPHLDPEGAVALERFIAAMDCTHTVVVEPLLRRLEVPALIVWAGADRAFDRADADWLRATLPNARDVVDVPGARLFFPEERPQLLADALRAHWAAA